MNERHEARRDALVACYERLIGELTVMWLHAVRVRIKGATGEIRQRAGEAEVQLKDALEDAYDARAELLILD